MTWEKVVERVTPSIDPLSDFVAAVDVIEQKLGIGTGAPTMSERLSAILTEFRQTGTIGESHAADLNDCVEQLQLLELFLRDFWQDGPPPDQPTSA